MRRPIFKKPTGRRDTANVTALLKQLHRIVNEAICTQAPAQGQADGLLFDLRLHDADRLRVELAKKVRLKATLLQDIRDIVEAKLQQMLANNPMRMHDQAGSEEIVAAGSGWKLCVGSLSSARLR